MIESHQDPIDESFHRFIGKYCNYDVKPIVLFGYPLHQCEYQFVIMEILVFCTIKVMLSNLIFPKFYELCFRSSKGIRLKHKFGESLYYWIYYVTIWSWSIYISKDEIWFKDPAYYWLPGEPYFPYKFKFIFLTQFSFYISASLMLFTSSRRKHSDKWLMLTHHSLTSLLILSSYLVDQWRIGMIVFLIHDTADIFLELSKICGYLSLYNVQKVTFTCFLLGWFIPRGIIYPLRVVQPSLIESRHWMFRREDVKIYRYFNMMLISLWMLTGIWSVSIAKFAISVLGKGENRDYRSEDEGEQLISKKEK